MSKRGGRIRAIRARKGDIRDIRDRLYGNSRGDLVAQPREEENQGDTLRSVQPDSRILPAGGQLESREKGRIQRSGDDGPSDSPGTRRESQNFRDLVKRTLPWHRRLQAWWRARCILWGLKKEEE